MRVLACEPAPDAAAVDALGVELVPIERVFAELDFVSLHLPSTAETAGLVDARLLSLMRPEAFFINAARGALVDEDALYAALREGRIAGAGLDVRRAEPPGDGRFEALENVVMTPHTGATAPLPGALRPGGGVRGARAARRAPGGADQSRGVADTATPSPNSGSTVRLPARVPSTIRATRSRITASGRARRAG